VLLGLLLGTGGAALMPADPVPPDPGPVPADAARATLRADERVIWTATVRMRGTDEVTAVATVLVVVAVVLTGQPALLGFLLIPVLLIVLGRWVTADRTGLWARSLLGAPWTGVAFGEVVRADVVPLHPLREFGGWGIRSDLKGRYGLVLRAGDAIAVQRAGGGVFVATVDGADDAVALLNGLADRARPPSRLPNRKRGRAGRSHRVSPAVNHQHVASYRPRSLGTEMVDIRGGVVAWAARA
jgi:hypothetical protein